MIITFFGHSSLRYGKDDEERLYRQIEIFAKGDSVDFYLGGYGSFDNLAKKCAKKYKETHADSRIVFITPYLDTWLSKRKEYLEKEYDEILYPPLENVPPKFAIARRNIWMINQADYIIAYVKTHYGGAYKSLLFAAKHSKTYINLFTGEYELY